MNVILASASPRRKSLLNYIFQDFKVIPSDCDETLPLNIATNKSAEYLARLKGQEIANKYPKSLVIGCDTIVVLNNSILGKPKDENQCREYLKMLSGNVHQVITGCALFYQEYVESFSVITDVYFRELSEMEIDDYIKTKEPFDKAGGYGIQGKGSLFVEKINGDYFNVVGLPISKLNQVLKRKEFNINE